MHASLSLLQTCGYAADACTACAWWQVRARTKSLFSIMKKLLRLEDLSKGGRSKEEIFDVLGMRAIVQPRQDLPPVEVG